MFKRKDANDAYDQYNKLILDGILLKILFVFPLITSMEQNSEIENKEHQKKLKNYGMSAYIKICL
jgi:hypothetical protein